MTTTADDVRGHGRRNPTDAPGPLAEDTPSPPDDVVGHGSKRPTDGQADIDDVRGHGFGLPCDDASSQPYDVVGHGAGQPAEAGSVLDAPDRWEKRLLQTVLRRDPESAVPR